MTTFHVRHDFTPRLASEALIILRAMPDLTKADFIAHAHARDLEIGRRQSPDKIIASLRDLGLVVRSDGARRDCFRLTPLGVQLADVAVRDRLLFAEFVHLRYWWLWSPERGGPLSSWAYQRVATALWEGAPMPVEADKLVGMVLNSAEQEFGLQGVSFSSASVLGILHWLRALSPACVIGGEFRRRPVCPPEALILTLEAIQTAAGRALGIPLRLDAATRARAYRALLIDDVAFDDVLAQAEETLGAIRRQSSSGDLVLIQHSVLPGLVASIGIP